MEATHEIGGSARRLAATLVDLARTRIELGATELAEERAQLTQQALVATVALFFLGIGLVLGVLAIAWWVGPAGAERVLGVAALAALAAAALALARGRRLARERPPLLDETLAQLRADVHALRPDRRTP